MSGSPVIAAGAGGDRRAASGAAVPRTSVSAPHTTASARIPTPIHTARATVSRVISRPMRIRTQSSPMATTASGVAKSSGLMRPVKRHPPMAVANTAAT